jgi:site-specific DNA-methyltransferase (adenine-specific)
MKYRYENGIIVNGDAIKLLKTMKDNSINLIVTDPPYKITSRGNTGNTGGMLLSRLSMNGKVFENNDVEVKDYAPEFFRILKNNTALYVMTNHINLIEMLNQFTSVGFHFIKSLIWNKGNKIMGRYYMSQFEYILFFRKGRIDKINNCGTSDIIQIPNKKTKGENGKNLHDTEKPVELMKVLISNSSKEGEVVLDPFMGIGSTIIAADELNRKFIGIEIDENYFKIAKERIESF